MLEDVRIGSSIASCVEVELPIHRIGPIAMNLCQTVLLASDAVRAKAQAVLSKLGIPPLEAPILTNGISQEILAECLCHKPSLIFVEEPYLPTVYSLLCSNELKSSLPSMQMVQRDVVALVGDLSPEMQTRLQSQCSLLFRLDWPVRVQRDALGNLLRRRAEQQKSDADCRSWNETPRLADFISESPRMQGFLAVVDRVANTDSTVLLLGESGVGKERLARAMHAASNRANMPFVAINCGALPESLLESELFGHEEGAFTGAVRPRKGYFEQAHRGAIFLDEIGDMPLHVQVKLLRVLQERCIQPLGSEKQIAVDVRVMAATNCDLREDVRRRKFREDLYYRLAVVTLDVPPLRERRQDIPVLLERHRKKLAARFHRDVQGFSPHALASLVAYDWPGNVRELVNVVERAVLLAPGPLVHLDDLPQAISHHPAAIPSGGGVLEKLGSEAWCELPWRQVRHELIEAAEREYLSLLLKSTSGRIGEAARKAGMTSRAMFDKLRHHGMDKADFRFRRGVSPLEPASKF